MVFHEKYAWIHDPGFLDSIAKTQRDAEKFSENIKQSIDASKQQNTAATLKAQEAIATLVKTEQNYLAEAQQIQQVKAREKQDVEELTSQLAELKAKEEKMPEIVESYQQQLQLAKSELDAKKKEINEKEKQIKHNEQQALMGLEFYRNRFGLQFEKLSDTGIRFIFDSIDPNNHQRKFTFVIFINKQDKYELAECKPKVSDTLMQTMLQELNEGNNMSRFVVQMRKRFQEKCIQ